MSTLFGTDYTDDNADKLATIVATDEGVAVNAASNNSSNLVAPGTTGFFKISVGGQAEVRSALSFDMTVNKDVVLVAADGGTANGYYPVVWTITDDNDDNAVLFTGTLTDLEAWIEDDEENTTIKTYATNEECDIDWTVTWAWAFEVDSDTNTMDTKLGDIVAMGNGYDGDSVTTFDFDLEIVIEQVQ